MTTLNDAESAAVAGCLNLLLAEGRLEEGIEEADTREFTKREITSMVRTLTKKFDLDVAND